jgi:REP element-mobilizing transposase RayT
METKYHKRNLPHIQIENMYNFITFRTFKSVDEYLQRLNGLNLSTKEKQYKIDKYLDNSQNGACFYGIVLERMKEILFEFDGVNYELVAFVIMPNHIHIIILPKINLAIIMKNLKGKSGKTLNELLEMSGNFWAREYYDKVIRNEKHLLQTIEYILHNPIKAGLKDAENRVWSKF